MSAFRLVADEMAGPTALGILARRDAVPSSSSVRAVCRGLVLVQASRNGPRRRSARWAATRPTPPATRFIRALLAGSGSVHATPAIDEGYHLRAQVGSAAFIACAHSRPAVHPAVFADAAGAAGAADALRPILCPAADAGQELYFNTRHFAR
jgi:hypothetical protein